VQPDSPRTLALRNREHGPDDGFLTRPVAAAVRPLGAGRHAERRGFRRVYKISEAPASPCQSCRCAYRRYYDPIGTAAERRRHDSCEMLKSYPVWISQDQGSDRQRRVHGWTRTMPARICRPNSVARQICLRDKSAGACCSAENAAHPRRGFDHDKATPSASLGRATQPHERPEDDAFYRWRWRV